MRLKHHFLGLRDFRVEGRCLHKLQDVLVLILRGVLADRSDFSEIHDFGVDKQDFLREQGVWSWQMASPLRTSYGA